jgi:hypothetical protein
MGNVYNAGRYEKFDKREEKAANWENMSQLKTPPTAETG